MPGRLLSALALCLTATQLAHAAPVVPGVRDDQPPEFAGRVLLSELNCANCHGGGRAAMEAKGAPDLRNAGARIRRGYLAEFIAAPHAAKPGTTMPDILGAAGLSDGDRAAAAEAISDFLFSLGGAEFKSDPVEAEAAERGGELFHQVGCVACHAPEGKALPGSPPLHRLAEKYSLASLTAFLEDPLAVRPGGRMPDLQLTHWEAADLASYLLLRDQKPETPPAAQTANAFARTDRRRALRIRKIRLRPVPPGRRDRAETGLRQSARQSRRFQAVRRSAL
ncbi:MAG: c-type cytochrome [Verrucomicrobiales bacterium]